MSHRFQHNIQKAVLGLVLLSTLLPSAANAGGGYGYGMTPYAGSGSLVAGPFTDVPGNSTNSAAIQYLKDQNVVQGYEDKTFKEDANINRAEFLKILIGTLVPNPVIEGCDLFSDVAKDAWYAPYVCEAQKRGVVQGYSDGTFKPQQAINFSEASKIIVNGLNVPHVQMDSAVWYKSYVMALGDKKAIPLTIRGFDQEITRGEMSWMIWIIKTNNTKHASRTFDEIQGDGLVNISSCQELFERTQTPQIRAESGVLLSPRDVNLASTNSMSYGGATGSYSPTNTQIPGVDEGDLYKTDGDYIYVAHTTGSGLISIVQATSPDALKEVATVRLSKNSGTPAPDGSSENFNPIELYATTNQLVVIGNYSRYGIYDQTVPAGKIVPPWYNSNKIKVFIFDTTNKASPKLVRTVTTDGNTLTSRRIGNMLHIVGSLYGGYYSIQPMADGTSTSDFQPGQATSTQVDESNFAPYMVDAFTTANSSGSMGSARTINCAGTIAFPNTISTNITLVLDIPLNDTNKSVTSKMLLADSGIINVTEQNMYISSASTASYYPPTASANTELRIRNDDTTQIYKLALEDKGVHFLGRGTVPGMLQSQFGMDEYEGNLRLVTAAYHPEINNGVTKNTLSILGPTMQTLGRIPDLVPGESVGGIRFLDNQAVVFTYRYDDPLVVLNLENPRKPVIQGSLKIPGQINYAQPYDKTHLITLGTYTSPVAPEGLNSSTIDPNEGALQLGLYDISNPLNPKEMSKQLIGGAGTSSDAQYNYKSLLFDKEKNLLAFPVTENQNTVGTSTDKCTTYSYDQCPTDKCQKTCVPSSCKEENGVQICSPDCNGANSCQSWNYSGGNQTVFQGAYVYSIDLTNGLQFKGKVTHFSDKDKDPTNGFINFYGPKAIARIMRIGESIYTVSSAMIKANALSSFAELKSITLSGE